MPTIQRYANLGAVVLPFIAFVLAIVLLWNKAVGAIDLATCSSCTASPASASRPATTGC